VVQLETGFYHHLSCIAGCGARIFQDVSGGVSLPGTDPLLREMALRVRARIPSHVWMLRRLSGKARGLRILLVWKGGATPPDGMDRRLNMGRYSSAIPKMTH